MINSLAKTITRHPKTVAIVALILLIPSALGAIFTPVNYDILSYLPEELDSVKGLDIIDEDFGEASMSIVVMENMSWIDMEKLEEDIAAIDNVRSVLWLGSIIDSPMPASMLPESVSSMLYDSDGDSTLMMIQFKSSGASNETLDTIKEIKRLLNKQCLMSGTAAVTYDLSELCNEEAPIFIAIAIALAVIALMFTMDSFILPLVLLAALGIAVVYNMGTNFIFGQISFITQSIAAILQLAVTMDYSVFLMDRYAEEKPKYTTREAAMEKAIVSSFTSLSGSSLTTVFGFLALCFMSFTLGKDIGLVMAKGVILGVAVVVVVLPALILICENIINKTHHKSIVPSFRGIDRLMIKFRKVMAIIFVILLVPAYYGQSHVEKYYNMMQAVPDDVDSIKALDTLKEDFNMAASYFVVTDDSLEPAKELELLDELENVDGVSSVMGLHSVLGTAFPDEIVPDSLKSMLVANGHQLIMVNSTYSPATDECNAQSDALNAVIHKYDSGAYLTGEPPMYKDLVEVTNQDFIVTNIISILAIFILIAIIFRSISIPLILVLSIEFAIWINLSISYLSGEVICFITPTIISCVQLGATVDYAILLTTRFREEIRSGKEKKQAMQSAADSALRSIFQSALVFFAACIGVYFICDIDIVSSICAMLARGAVISGLVMILFLTPLLVVCEGVINKTTYHWREAKTPTEFTRPMLEKMQEKAKKNEKRLAKQTAKAEKKSIKQTKRQGKAIPVPAELVAQRLDSEESKKIEQAVREAEKAKAVARVKKDRTAQSDPPEKTAEMTYTTENDNGDEI